MTKTITINYGSGQAATPASDVFYTVVDSDGNSLISRTNEGVTADDPATGIFAVQISNWNPNWQGTITWDILTANIIAQTFTHSLSLSSIADATAYFATRLFASLWPATSTESQQNALNDATRIINRLSWKGYPTLSNQYHSWPRTGLYMQLVAIDFTTVPQDLLQAQYEMAFALIKGFDPEREVRNASVISRGYSSVRVAYNPNLVADFIRYGIPSLAAWNLMLPYFDMTPSGTVRLHRVS